MGKITFCNNCGEEIKNLSQKFCEKCGSSVQFNEQQREQAPKPIGTPTSISSVMQPYDHPGGLFDLNRNYYVLKEKYFNNLF